MSDQPNRKWIYALVPLGFVLIVGAMLLGGEVVQETTDGVMVDEVEEKVD